MVTEEDKVARREVGMSLFRLIMGYKLKAEMETE